MIKTPSDHRFRCGARVRCIGAGGSLEAKVGGRFGAGWLVAVSFALLPVQAHAMHALPRCVLALTTVVTKGPGPALVAWTEFRDDRAHPRALLTNRSRRTEIRWRVEALARRLGRDVNTLNVVDIARELIADSRTELEILNDLVDALRVVANLPNATHFIDAIRRHPNLDTPLLALRIAANPAAKLSRGEVADLLFDTLDAETHDDILDEAVPRSAWPAAYLVELEQAGRLGIGDFGLAYARMFDNPRASDRAFVWIVGELVLWAKGRYVHRLPLPPRDLSRVLMTKARARINRVKNGKPHYALQIDLVARMLDVE